MLTVEDSVFVSNIEMHRKIIDRFSNRSLALKLIQMINSEPISKFYILCV